MIGCENKSRLRFLSQGVSVLIFLRLLYTSSFLLFYPSTLLVHRPNIHIYIYIYTALLKRYAVVAVWDQMLQAIDQKEGTGYLAYEQPWLQNLAAAYMPHRVLITRIMLLVGWPAPVRCTPFSEMHARTCRSTPKLQMSAGTTNE
jgi:hypothetical protein